MKKILLSALILTGLAFASCEKESNVSPSANKVQKTQARDKSRTSTWD